MNNIDNNAENVRIRVRKVAHDVRTPLTSIAGFAQLLIDDAALSANSRENAETIFEEAKRVSEMLEAFFDDLTDSLDDEAPTIDEL